MIMRTQPRSSSTDMVICQPRREPDIPSTAGLSGRLLGRLGRFRNGHRVPGWAMRNLGSVHAGRIFIGPDEGGLQPVDANVVLLTPLEECEIFICSAHHWEGSEVWGLEGFADRIVSD